MYINIIKNFKYGTGYIIKNDVRFQYRAFKNDWVWIAL